MKYRALKVITSIALASISPFAGAAQLLVLNKSDATLIFVAPEKALEIRNDQINCMGCLSACQFSNWAQNEQGSTGKKADPRSYCIQKTLQAIRHSDDIAFQPKSYNQERPLELWIGGEAKVAQRRAGRVGDSWFPYFPRITPEDMASKYALVRQTAEEAGRNPDDVTLNCCLSVEVTETEVLE